jgi:hypothetical protein
MQLPLRAHERPRIEGTQIQARIVEEPLCLRIPGLQDLETAIQEKAVASIGAHTPARGVRRLDQQGLETTLAKCDRTGQSGETGTDDDDVCAHG